MSIDHPHSPAVTKVISRWHRLLATYRLANRLSHHVLGALLKTAIFGYFIFGVLFLVLRYAVLPNISHYKPDIERIVAAELGQPISIGSLQASWDGLRPHLDVVDLRIKDKFGRDALTLPKVSATVSWWSVTGTFRLRYLEIDQPDLDIRLDADGKLFVAGIPVPTEGKNDGKGADWLLSQKEIVIREGRLRWNDNQRGAPELLLNNVNFVLRNHWQHHEFAISALPPATLAGPLDVRASFDNPFTHSSADVSRWKGELYADLLSADLAAWKQYFNYPIEVQQGHGSLRAWLDFDHAKVADLTADMNVADAAIRLQKDVPVLGLTQLSGRVSIREDIAANNDDGTPTFGANGHAISLINLAMRTTDGLVLPPTTITESFEPTKNGQPPKTEFSATLLDLQTLANIAERLPLTADQRLMLANFAPRGQVRNLSVQWQGNYPSVSAYDVKGDFAGLSMKAREAQPAKPRVGKIPAQAAVPFIPGFENLTGQVAMSDRGGMINLDSDKFQIEMPGLFNDDVIPFDKLTMQAIWSFPDKDQLLVQIQNLNFIQDGIVASLSGTHQMSLSQQRSKSPGIVDLVGHVDEFDVKKLDRYLPSSVDAHFRSWITGALVSGSARDVNLKLKGDLKDFPFRTHTPTETPKGDFSVSGKVDGITLNYAPNEFRKDGKSLVWPLLQDIQGTITFDRASMVITADHAITHGTTLTNVKAVLPDLAPPKNILDIDGTATGPLSEFLGYSTDSVVQDMIGGFTNETKGTGNARLALKLQLPLSDINHSKVLGKLQFANNDIDLFAGLPTLSNTTGQLEFSEKGFGLNGIHTTFLGGPATVSGGGPPEATVVKAEGMITGEGLHKYAAGSADRLAKRVNGSTRFEATVTVKKNHADVLVTSNLQGLAFDLPAPLHKDAAEVLPTRFEMLGLPSTDAATVREEMRLSLGNAIAARYEREKSVERTAAWHVVRGGVAVNASAPPPQSGVLLNLNMKSLNVDAWLDMMSSLSTPDKAKEPGAQVDTLDLSEFITPQVLAVRANEMFFLKRKLDNVSLGATLDKDLWQANVDSAQASGYVTYSAKADQGKGKVTANLASLIIAPEVASQVTELLDGKNATSDLPALDIKADNFDLLGKHLGHVELLAHNSHRPGSNEWLIRNLVVSNADAELSVTRGTWTSKDNDNQSSFNYSLDVKDAGGLLTRLGFAGLLNGGKGKMDGDISWNGAPYSLDYPSMSGNIHMKMQKGQFLKEGAGAGRLLGVLSLQSLPRRLTLDFRDIFSEGFAFDEVTMDAKIAKGVFSTGNMLMHGLDATVVLDGSADIVKETENMHVAVIPQLDVSGASVAYGLLVNPVIGLGSFLAQLFLKAPLSKALTHEYEISGPWKDPVVTKMDRKTEDQAAASPTAAHTVSAQ